jgi:hypothetical protein
MYQDKQILSRIIIVPLPAWLWITQLFSGFTIFMCKMKFGLYQLHFIQVPYRYYKASVEIVKIHTLFLYVCMNIYICLCTFLCVCVYMFLKQFLQLVWNYLYIQICTKSVFNTDNKWYINLWCYINFSALHILFIFLANSYVIKNLICINLWLNLYVYLSKTIWDITTSTILKWFSWNTCSKIIVEQ